MKNGLLIKLNDLIVDTCSCCDRATKKSIEFFLGRMIADDELIGLEAESYAEKISCIESFLNSHGLCLRQAAIMKKFNEYYVGKEFSGLIREASLLVSSNKIDKISKVTFLSMMPKEETTFLMSNLGIKAEAISCDNVNEGIAKAKKKISNFSYVGNSMADYEAATENNVPFIAVAMDEEIKGEKVNKIEELL